MLRFFGGPSVTRISGIIYFLLLSLAVASAVFAISLAGRGQGFAEYGLFLLVAAVLWIASRFFRRMTG
jgi:hypothetical protein